MTLGRTVHLMLAALIVVVACDRQLSDPPQAVVPASIPLEHFTREPARDAYQLSPSGSFLAWLEPWQSRANIFVRRVGGAETRRLTSFADQGVTRFQWHDDEHILFLMDEHGDENYRLYGVDRQAGDIVCYTPFDGVKVRDLRPGQTDDEVYLAMNRHDASLFDGYLLDLGSRELSLVFENPGDIEWWFPDREGHIRLARRRVGVETSIVYRDDESQPFREIVRAGWRDTFEPQGWTLDSRRVIAYSDIGRERNVVVALDPATADEEVLLEDDTFDIFGDDERDRLVFDGHDGRLLYAIHTTTRRQTHAFDDDVKDLLGRLAARFPGYEVTITSRSNDGLRCILRVSSDRLPGTWYLFDRRSDELTMLDNQCPWLPEQAMAPMEAVQYSARDGLTIHAYLTLPLGRGRSTLPVIVWPHAGPFWRNSWGFDPIVQFFANRGYAVLQPNFRGSEGFGRSFKEAGYKQTGRKVQDDITDGVRWLIDQGVADPERIAIFGWSYGGHAVLRGLTQTPELYACGIDLWGVSNMFTFYEGFPPYWRPYLEVIYEQFGHPVDDRELLDEISPALHADKIVRPLLIAQGANDPRVPQRESDQMVAALRARGLDVTYILKEDEGHGFRKPENRLELYREIESFLAKHLG